MVLYGSEEIGLFGGDAYARQHADELDKHVLAAESDHGASYIWQFQTKFGDGALDYAKKIQGVLARYGVAAGDNLSGGGPDIGVLARSGVPVVTPAQDGWDYSTITTHPTTRLTRLSRMPSARMSASMAWPRATIFPAAGLISACWPGPACRW